MPEIVNNICGSGWMWNAYGGAHCIAVWDLLYKRFRSR